MITAPGRAALALLLAVLATPAAFARGVRIVSATGDQNFTGIQAAIDAAAQGDVLLIGEGTYASFSIDGKSLSLYAAPGANVQVSDRVSIRNLGPKQSVVLSGIRASGVAFQDQSVLLVEDNQGYVRLQDCEFLGLGGGYLLTCTPLDGGSGARVVDSERVAMLGVRLHGAEGQWQDAFNIACDGGDGGSALIALRSRIALHGSELTGGVGGKAKGLAGPGGIGFESIESEVYASGGFIVGGLGGTAYGPGIVTVGGPGLALDATTVLDTVDCPVTGGPGNPPGQAVTGAGFHNPLPAAARSLDVATVTPAGTPLTASFVGEANDLVWLSATASSGHLWQTASWGVLLTKYPSFVLYTPLGAASATGTATFTLPVGQTTAGAAHRQLVFQGLVRAAAGHRFLSSARHVLALSPTVGPDCNGNGTSDYLDVITGTSSDIDHDLVPDECP